MTTEPQNGRATLREVYALLDKIRGEVGEGFDRLEAKVDARLRDYDTRLRRQEGRVNWLMGGVAVLGFLAGIAVPIIANVA